MGNAINENEVLSHVQDLLKQQTEKGLEKYGHTVNPKEYDVIGWVDHLQQELIDALVYSTIIKMRDAEDPRQGMLEDLYAENEQLKERVQELEEDLRLSEQEEKRRWKENKRYRETLKYYADEENYEDLGHGEHAITYDNGDEARKALKEHD